MSAKAKPNSPSRKKDSDEKTGKKKKQQGDGMRETVESIAIAFVLAFLFKTFQAEAYVIPTGSMAPTLYGRHKEIICDGCGFEFALGASSEIDQETGRLEDRIQHVYCGNCGKENYARDAAVFNGDRILVNKQFSDYQRFDVVVFKNPEQAHVNYIKRLVGLPNETIRIRKGDIWAKPNDSDDWKIQRKQDPFVQKDIQLTVYDDRHPARPLIELGWPERWEPSVAATALGSVGGWGPAQNDWQPNRNDRTYQCNAGDNLQWLRYRHFQPNESTWPDGLIITGFVIEDQVLTADTRFLNDPDGTGEFSYQWIRNNFPIVDATNHTYTLDSADVGTVISVSVSYADGEDRDRTVTSERTSLVADVQETPGPKYVYPDLPAPAASLVADFCTFNAYSPSGYSRRAESVYWVGDLTLNVMLDVSEAVDGAEIILELIEGPETFQCVVNINTGTATLQSLDSENRDNRVMIATGETDLVGVGSWEVCFANVDDRLCFWVDGDLVRFDTSTSRQSSDVPEPSERDLAPCGIALRNAKATISGLLLQRDIYYRNDIIAFDQEEGVSADPAYYKVQHDEVPQLSDLRPQLTNPDGWAQKYQKQSEIQLNKYGRYGEYRLDEGEYLMFGDNSSMSKDSRLFDFQSRPMNGIFSHRYAVREQDLIGKALFIFWPHGIPFLNNGHGIAVRYHSGRDTADPDKYPSVRVPFYPNLQRMKKIR
ncbi:MAG: signal peptidase I [Fuerstiella sp.]